MLSPINIALVGMPNTGKSTLFNRITGGNARTGNWPGITTELLTAKQILGNKVVNIIDLPGVYDLDTFSEDEGVVRDFLASQPISLIAITVNAVQLDRQLALVLQLKSLGLPVCVCINMADEAQSMRLDIDANALAKKLQCPVLLISAKKGTGIQQLLQVFERHAKPVTTQPVPLAYNPQANYYNEAAELWQTCVSKPKTLPQSLTEKIDRWLLHPWLGLMLFVLILWAAFQGVYSISGPLQDMLGSALDFTKVRFFQPLIETLALPAMVESFLINGLWDGLATVASFMPVVLVFFVAMSLLEDSGYLSRIAYLVDALMVKLGLDGRSLVMVLMGFGCNVPALMGTRVMRSRGMRLLTMLIIPFSLCSARLQVFVFLIGILFARSHAGFVLLSLYLMGVAAAVLTALLFKNRFPSTEPFVVELPPYRLPTMRVLWRKSIHEMGYFVRRAATFITLGVIAVWFLTYFPWGVEVASAASFAGMLGAFVEPVFAPLGIDAKLSISLIFGFIAKEIVVGALAVIYSASDSALQEMIKQQYNWVQAYSFMLFVLLYTPCLATIATIRAESKSRAFTVLSVAWALLLAWVVSFTFYQVASRLFL